MKTQIPIERHDDIYPVCPHCKADLKRIAYREMQTDIMGSKRCIYFCPECKSCLGFSHRKGFFLGL